MRHPLVDAALPLLFDPNPVHLPYIDFRVTKKRLHFRDSLFLCLNQSVYFFFFSFLSAEPSGLSLAISIRTGAATKMVE